MLKLSIIFGLLASVVWRTTPTSCRQTTNTTIVTGNGNRDMRALTTMPPSIAMSAIRAATTQPITATATATQTTGTTGTTPTPTATATLALGINEAMTTNVLHFMDTTARPCENFYRYACGRWYQAHIEQFDFGDTLGLLDYNLNRKLEHLLRRNVHNANSNSSSSSTTTTSTTTATMASTTTSSNSRVTTSAGSATNDALANEAQETEFDVNEDESGIYQKVHLYYRSCKKVKPYNLKKYLLLVMPGGVDVNWFALSRNGGKHWSADKFNWLLAIAKLRLYGLNGVLLKEEVLPRWDEASSNSIYLDKPNLAETQPMGQGVMIELLLDIGQTKRVANELAREVDAFEVRLHRLQEIEDEEGAKEMQLGYLQEYMPEVDWYTYLKQIQGPTIDLAGTVIIQNIPYMRALVKLLSSVERRTVCNYIMLKFLQYLTQHGPAEISRHECIASLRRAMPLATSYIIGRHFYKDPTHNDLEVQRIFNTLKQQFTNILKANRLQLPPAIVYVLVEKIDNMRLQVGNSPRNASVEFYNDYYERVALDANNFYVNQLSLLRLQVEKSHESLDMDLGSNLTESLNETFIVSDMIGSSSSPFYVKPKNLIIVPYGFLQMPVYNRHLRPLFKYAIFGFAIAHELLHGFDSSGIDYDNIGNIMGPSEEITANKMFMQGLRCMQNELATGSRSLNEKLADYEGFRLVYETFFSVELSGNGSDNDPELKRLLPQFTEKQLFFITFAQFFCSKEHRAARELIHMEHAVDELRVFQTLANFEEFATAFNCERRDKMKLKSRCRLW